MSQRRESQGKGEGEEGTDGAGKQGGGGGKDDQPHQKKIGLAGAARFAKKRITGQPRSSSVAKEQDKKHFSPPLPAAPSSPLTPPPPGAAQPQPRLSWESWQKSPDPQQPIASASVATPPVDNIIVPPQEPLLPQETDDAELSLKLTRMELERDRYKRDIENKERQLKEYEEELITLRMGFGTMSQQSKQWKSWQQQPEEQQPVEQQPERRDPLKAHHSLNPSKLDLSLTKQQPQPHQNDDKKSENDEYVSLEPPQESGIEEMKGAIGTWLVVGQSTEQELTDTIRQLENEKSELEKGKEELAKKKEELERENKALQEAKDKLEEKEKEVIKLKLKASSNKAILEKRLKDKDKELEAKQQLERELVEAKEELKLVEERFKITKNEELKKQLNELEKERNDKVEQLQQKYIKIKQLEEQLSEKQKQLSEKEKYIFDMEASATFDRKERERLNKEKEKESDKNIAYATQRIDELERQQQEQLQAIKNLTEENERLRVGGSELTRELNEKDAELEEWHTKVAKLEEEVERIRIEEGEKRAELENKFRREQEDSKQETQRLLINQQEAARAKYDGRIKEWQAKLMEVEEGNKKLEEQLSEKEIERMSLSDKLAAKDKEILNLKEQLHDKGQKNAILQKSLDEKSQTAIALEKQVGTIMKSSKEKEERIKELVEKLQLKETEITIIKEDFKAERSERERSHAELNDLQGKCGLLQQELVEKDQKLAKAQKKFYDLQQSYTTAGHDLKKSQMRITTLLKKDAESSETIQSLTKEKIKMDKQLKEMKTMETDRMKELEEEIQVLTAQVNAYSRECEKQKGLVAQNQERHKTEIQVLNEKLTNEQKSKQQLESQLTTMKQQFDSVSASKESLRKSNQQLANEWTMLREQFDNLIVTNNSLCATNERLQQSKQQLVNELAILREQVDSLTTSRESLLTSYNQEQAMVASLEQQLQRMREANKVLMEKVRSNQQVSNELAVARQRYDSVYASKMKLLKENDHHVQEIERLNKENDVIQRSLEKASSQLLSKQEEVVFLHKILSEFESSWKFNHKDVTLSEQELGRGGWGVVLEGQLRYELRLKVAVKQLHGIIKSEMYLEMFQREINTMSQIRHPNILHFFGAVLDHPSGNPMIITEVMDTSLRKAYESNKLAPHPSCRPVILSIVRDVAVALNYLHCLPDPIIHRDVSSANVLLQSIVGPRKWKAKISDFGSANLARKAVTENPGAAVYSAPEVLMRNDPTKKQTPKMDVFSYGVLLCEAVTCRFPYKDAFQDMLRQVYRISDRPRGSRSTQGYLLHALILSSCDDDPSKRPTMNEVIEQLGIIAM